MSTLMQKVCARSALLVLLVLMFVPNADAQTPYLVHDINATSEGAGSSLPGYLTAVNGVLYFTATDAVHGVELWRTDGTSTALVSEILVGPGSTSPQSVGKCGDSVCFTYQYELWRSDGSGAESVKVFPGLTRQPIDINGVTFLIGQWNPDTIHRLHSDGTTELLTSGSFQTFLQTRSDLLFSDLDSIGYSDGSVAGTQTAVSFPQGPKLIGEANGTAFFTKSGPLHVIEFWQTQGTPETTQYLATLEPRPYEVPGIISVNVNGVLFFLTAPEYTNHAQLWKSDGRPAGTVTVKTGFIGNVHDFPSELTNLNGVLLFIADDGENGRELWISDGSEAGTRILKDIFPGPDDSNPKSLTVVDGIAYFQANDGVTGAELWRTDGTAEGTERVYDLVLGPVGSSPAELTRSGNKIYFAATTPETGRELWAYPLPEEVVISASDFIVTESSGTGSFRVSLSMASSVTVSVRADFGNGTADANVDYAGTGQLLIFEPGEITKDFSLTVLNDSLPEPDQTVLLDLSLPTNARIGRNQSVATIRDDDRAADLEIRAEGTGFVVFNHGPSVATDVVVQLTPNVETIHFPEIAVDAARSMAIRQVSAYTGVVSSSIPDPAPSNNTASGMENYYLYIHCDHISTSGTRATVYLSGESIQEEVVTLSATPASAVSLPSTIVIPAHVSLYDFMIQGLVEGPVTININPAWGGQTSTQTYSIETSVTSEGCPLSPGSCVPPVLTSVPEFPKHVLSGTPFTLSVRAEGSPDLHYGWSPTDGSGGGYVGSDWERTLTAPGILTARVRASNACGTASAPVHVQSFRRRPADFRASNVSQSVIYRNGAWVNHSAPFGGVWTGQSSPNCIPAPADYNGDGVAEMAMLCNGAWNFYNSDGSLLKGIWTGGAAGELPVPADYDGDGDDDVVVYRNGAWRFYDYATGNFIRGVWTGPGPNTIPVPGDYDGDGKADFSVYARGPWHFYKADGTYLKGIWTGGDPRDIPVPGDYTVDGKDEVVIFRAGAWIFYDFITRAHVRGVWTGVAPFNGLPLQPAPLDTDGDGTVEFTIFAGGPWHFYNDNGSYWRGVWTGGVAGDQAISRRQHTTP